MKALVVADGEVARAGDLDASWPGWSAGVSLVIAADGGALGARALGLRIDAVVGDMDSLPADELDRLAAEGAEVRRAAVDKDESDSELAVLEAIRRGATDLTILGALGGVRFDHALANVALLAASGLAGRQVRLMDARTRVSAIVAPGPDGRPVRRPLPGRIGDVVSLLPFGADAAEVRTEGLRFPLGGETLRAGPARGLSNIRVAEDASVEVGRGFVVVVESPAAILAGRPGL